MAFLQALLSKISTSSLTGLSTKRSKASVHNIGTLNDRLERYAPLFELQERRQLLEVLCHKSGRRYQSIILTLDFHNQTVELDELFPAPPEPALQPGDKLTVRHHRHGMVMSFTGTIENIQLNRSGALYYLTLPDQIAYQQRRQHPRANLSREYPLNVKLLSPNKMPWYATASNLSVGGMRLMVGGNIVDELHRDSRLPLCEFSVSKESKISCRAQVKSYRFCRRPYRHTEISIEFKELAPESEQELAQIISSLPTQAQAA